MKISKKQNVTANTNLEVAAVSTCKYANAIELVSAAIESLAEVARDDELAKDSIANLGVVLLELKGGCE